MCRCTRPSSAVRTAPAPPPATPLTEVATGTAPAGTEPTDVPHELQNCAPEPIAAPHLSQNMDCPSLSMKIRQPHREGSSATRPVRDVLSASSPSIPCSPAHGGAAA